VASSVAPQLGQTSASLLSDFLQAGQVCINVGEKDLLITLHFLGEFCCQLQVRGRLSIEFGHLPLQGPMSNK
jgi:hypothetical protein